MDTGTTPRTTGTKKTYPQLAQDLFKQITSKRSVQAEQKTITVQRDGADMRYQCGIIRSSDSPAEQKASLIGISYGIDKDNYISICVWLPGHFPKNVISTKDVQSEPFFEIKFKGGKLTSRKSSSKYRWRIETVGTPTDFEREQNIIALEMVNFIQKALLSNQYDHFEAY